MMNRFTWFFCIGHIWEVVSHKFSHNGFSALKTINMLWIKLGIPFLCKNNYCNLRLATIILYNHHHHHRNIRRPYPTMFKATNSQPQWPQKYKINSIWFLSSLDYILYISMYFSIWTLSAKYYIFQNHYIAHKLLLVIDFNTIECSVPSIAK